MVWLAEIPHDKELDVVLYQGGYTCVTADAEYLSPAGWRRIDTLTKQDMLAVYYDNGSIVYEHPKEVFKWETDYWYEFHTRTLHQKLCPNHKIVTWKNNKKYVQSMLEFYDEHNNSTNGHTGKFRTTFNIEGKKLPYTDDELRFIIAYQADGTKANEGCARFHLSKKRKLKRLLDLLDKPVILDVVETVLLLSTP